MQSQLDKAIDSLHTLTWGELTEDNANAVAIVEVLKSWASTAKLRKPTTLSWNDFEASVFEFSNELGVYCSNCGKRFFDNYNLKSHVEREHPAPIDGQLKLQLTSSV